MENDKNCGAFSKMMVSCWLLKNVVSKVSDCQLFSKKFDSKVITCGNIGKLNNWQFAHKHYQWNIKLVVLV